MDIIPGPVVTLEAMISAGVQANWVDLTCDVFGIRYNVGRQRGGPQAWMSQVTAGEMVLDLNNETGRYSAFSGDGNLVFGEGTLMRLRCQDAQGHHALFLGLVEEWKEDWTAEVDKVTITCVDPLGVLAEQGGDYEWVPGKAGQTPRARIEQLLNRAGVLGEPFYSDKGHITCISPKLSSVSVLDEIQRTAMSDLGVLFHEPAAITDPASVAGPFSQWVYLDRNRFAKVSDVLGGNLPNSPVPTTAADWRNVAGPMDRTMGSSTRPAQARVPIFSDACVKEGDTFYGYTDIEWSYIAWERPSLVVVQNLNPPEDRDDNGNLLAAPWAQFGAQVAVDSLRHKIVSITDLRYSTASQAQALAGAIAVQLGTPKLEVTSLKLWPHYDINVFKELMKLRLQDHIVTIRNLVHGGHGVRVLIESLVEGMEVTLTPRPSWVQGQHIAEWNVTLILAPVVADIEDNPDLPPDVEPGTGDVYVLSQEGQTPNAGILPTGFIGAGATMRVAYTTTGLLTQAMYVEMENIASGSPGRFDITALEKSVVIAGGHAVSAVIDTASRFAGSTYRIRVVEAGTHPDASNWVTVTKPLPTPSKPTIVNLSTWQHATYTNPTAPIRATPTTITWTAVAGVRYQVGIKPNLSTGGAYIGEPVQAGNMWVGSLDSDTSYQLAVRLISGGTIGPWSAPLKVTMGHSPEIIESDMKMLADSGTIDRAPGLDFVCAPPLITPGPGGGGDNQWTYTTVTYNPNYAGKGFVGTIVSELRVRAENYRTIASAVPFGTYITVPAYGLESRTVQNGRLIDQVPTSVKNPTWSGSNFTQGYWRASIQGSIHNGSAVAQNRYFGIRSTGYANASLGVHTRGQMQAWGREYTAISRLSNKVIP